MKSNTQSKKGNEMVSRLTARFRTAKYLSRVTSGIGFWGWVAIIGGVK